MKAKPQRLHSPVMRVLVFSALVSLLSTRLYADGWDLDAHSSKASALHGRLRDGNTGLPVAEGHVFVLDSSHERILGHSRTKGGLGPDSGFWQVTGLPASGDVWLVAFHPKFTRDLGVTRVKLDATYKNIPDLSTSAATMQAVPDAKGGIISLLGTIAREATRITGEREAATLAEKLLQQLRAERSVHARKKEQDLRWRDLREYPGKSCRDMAAVGADARIYVGGGCSVENITQTEFYEYDPKTDTYKPLDDLPVPRRWHRFVFLAGGVFLLGGSQDRISSSYNPSASKDVWRYSIEQRKWQRMAPLRRPRSNFAVAVVGGKIYVFGGDSNGWRTTDAEVYDSSNNTWTSLPSKLPPAAFPYRSSWNAAALGSKVYLFCGVTTSVSGRCRSDQKDSFDQTWVYEPSRDSYSRAAPRPIDSVNPGVVASSCGVIVFGGSSESGGALSRVDVYRPASDTWSKLPSMLMPTQEQFGFAFTAGYCVRFGGNVRKKSWVESVKIHD